MKKVVLLLTIVGLTLYTLSAFFYIDFEREDFCVIKVLPSFLISNLDIKGSLSLIKHASPTDYAEVCKRVRVINKNPGCGGLDGGCFYENKPSTIYILAMIKAT